MRTLFPAALMALTLRATLIVYSPGCSVAVVAMVAGVVDRLTAVPPRSTYWIGFPGVCPMSRHAELAVSRSKSTSVRVFGIVLVNREPGDSKPDPRVTARAVPLSRNPSLSVSRACGPMPVGLSVIPVMASFMPARMKQSKLSVSSTGVAPGTML